MEINRILVFQEIPPGWTLLNGALTPPVGYKLICNGKSRFSADYKTGLIEDNPQTEPPPISEAAYTAFKEDGAQKSPQAEKGRDVSFSNEPGLPEKLNRLAREQIKLRLLRDIEADITVSKLEGWDYKDYLLELKEEISRFLDRR